jgi:2-C-methyl-D-erythritol 4-phosphate cytidylyltransferase
MKRHNKTTAILLAGGTGTRMGAAAPIPKQYLQIHGKAIVQYSFDLFVSMDEIDEIVVVCDPLYEHFFAESFSKPLRFALPGPRRQDSVLNGFHASSPESTTILVHDGARPIINEEQVRRALDAGIECGAATLGMPVKFTVKVSDTEGMVVATPDRTTIWEIQTPQVLRRDIFQKGFAFAKAHNATVTDDVSLAELIGAPVKLVEGSHTNIKITVPSDLIIATNLLDIPCHTTTN